jgi:ATP-dependent DNA helicase RecQ
LFSDYSRIDEDILSKRANISRDLVYQYLTALSKTKVINYIPARKSPMVVFCEERVEDKSLHISYESYHMRKERYERRMNAMLEYALSNGDCRNNFLLKYFGQLPGKPCGQCDVCKSRLEDETSPERREQIKSELLELLKQNPQYLGELQEALEVKENTIDSLIRNLLDEEKVQYLEDGRLSIV